MGRENTEGTGLVYLEGTDDPAPRSVGLHRIFARFSGAGMSDVYLAHKRSSFGFVRLAVVKHAPRDDHDFQVSRQMLFDEAHAISYLDHPNLVTLLDADEDDTGAFIALEYVDGTDMRQINAKLRQRGEALPFELACFIASEILRGLHHAHTARKPDGSELLIVHRDVNPSNILISRTGHVKLTDFGVVHMQDRVQDPTQPGLVKGKFAYLAPEYIKGQPVDARMDIYSVGVVLFELLTGRPLFTGDSAYDIMRKIVNRELRLERLEREGVGESLRSIVERAVAAHPNQRFATAEDMANALETWIIKSSLHVSPWILSAFFRQHELFHESPHVSLPVSMARGTSEPPHHRIAEEKTVPGVRPPLESSPPFPDVEVVNIPPPDEKTVPAHGLLPPEQATSPGAPVPNAQTERSRPPDMSDFGAAPTQRENGPAFPSFTPPGDVPVPENIATTPGARSPYVPATQPVPAPPRNVGPPSLPPFTEQTPAPFDTNEPTVPSNPPQRFVPPASTPPLVPPPVPNRGGSPPPAETQTPDLVHSSERPSPLGIPVPSGSTPGMPAPSMPPPAPSTPPVGSREGELSDLKPGRVLSQLIEEGVSGTLEFRCGLIWKKVDLHDGQVLTVTSNMGMEDIGEQLIKERLIQRPDLDRAMRESHGRANAILERLLAHSSISQTDLGRQLGGSAERLLNDVLTWEEGTFSFRPGIPDVPPVLPSLNMADLLSGRRGSQPAPRPSTPQPSAGDPLPEAPRKRPSLADALGIARQVNEGPPKS